ncbi:MAG TPA: sigma-54 dependent transcriptional regulator [Planctomycetota bacterium]|jgi:DNA-binding NtrC family response regulator|nr:sigma-54 dependent transcriptional regulator [Planctomycetota bacterium]
MPARVLIVDDEKMIRWSLRASLEETGYEVGEADKGATALEAFARETPDLVLLDYRLPDRTGLDVLKSLHSLAPDVPVLLLTAHASLAGAVAAVKEGAFDYLAKPYEVDDLILRIGRALEASALQRQVDRRREQERAQFGLANLVAESPAMGEVVQLVRRVAQSEATTILLLGETGVGKGLVARALHHEGRTADGPFLDVTCTAIPETLLESELFGHERGAFTDARTQKHGLFELADGGTVLLDEMGDLPPGLQAKLLRVLEDKTFRRVGGTRDLRVSVRIVAATNRDLDAEVAEGRFRRDLYFRLKVIPILLPPLRERPADVEPLARRFLGHFRGEFRKEVSDFEPAALEALRRYPWPGNVRELQNAIERAVLLTESEVVRRADLPREIAGDSGGSPGPPSNRALLLPAEGVVLEELERDLVRQALERTKGNRSRAARLLGLNRDQIRYRIAKFRFGDGPAPGSPENRAGG